MGGVTVLFVSVEMQAEVAFTNSKHVKKMQQMFRFSVLGFCSLRYVIYAKLVVRSVIQILSCLPVQTGSSVG